MNAPSPAGSASWNLSLPSLRLSLGGLLALVGLLSACDGSGSPTDPVDPLGEITCDPAGSATVNGRVIPAAPHGYVTVENQIISLDTCQPHRILGISRPGLHYAARDPGLEGAAGQQEFARIREWGVNTVRLTVTQNFWVPTSKWYDPQYPSRVEAAVRLAREAGLDVILVLQTSDRGDPAYPGFLSLQQPMPDRNHTVPFWRDLATMFKDDGRVIFELFGEPYPSHGPPDGTNRNWDLWLNGGTVPAGEVYGEIRGAYDAVGMQELYGVVRAAGAHNLVLIGGTHWGYYLDEVPSHPIQGHNFAFTAHPWDWASKQPGNWEKDWGFLADDFPIVVSEFGDYSCNRGGYTQAVLDYADSKGLSWVAWAWIAPDADDPDPQTSVCEFPMLLSDWSGIPSAVGSLVKARLASY